ncbi:acyltransferase family protein [Paraurantiacibacter namhicola]|uniref:Acyltransferase family protein n=1 Tax=Paraurantiacibacter namhicola TaxID=645517 RepID=A0A1C7D6U2_9SPHN|nr:acyltransferase [Paraurantiacibacter namhicola]ANU07189.1 Acyltransferase family protein [Paraurantiacibacter namhicola]
MTVESTKAKIVSVQALRALAAGTVALVHIAWGFADHVGGGFGVRIDMERAAQAAVVVFFVISGFIMVVASRHLFGEPGARRIFLLRRAIRILPPYWIASALLAAVLGLMLAQDLDWLRFAQSLVLVPYWPDNGSIRPTMFLWTGWTLFFEMVFYLLFGMLMTRGRAAAISGALCGIAVLVLAGFFIPPENVIAWSLTRPILLMFPVGIAMAVLRESGLALPAALRLAILAAAAASWWMLDAPGSTVSLGVDYVLWAGLPPVLFTIAVLGGPLDLPAPAFWNAGGDISYALYLLHVPLAWAWIWIYPRLPFVEPDPWGFLVTVSFITLLASWIFYRFVEVPLTRRLLRLSGAREDRSEMTHRATSSLPRVRQ